MFVVVHQDKKSSSSQKGDDYFIPVINLMKSSGKLSASGLFVDGNSAKDDTFMSLLSTHSDRHVVRVPA